ncbi:MAG: hypothetical protein ABI431_04760, partial [Candidatus Tumulicola sp.]
MSKHLVSLLLAAAVLAVPLRTLADQNATYHGPASASEKAFVAAIQADLMKRYPTVADAEKAGYIRYTNEDETGAISYANLHWQSTDAKHPSQLWYGKDGNLLGADYSVLVSANPGRPTLWGINPGRWVEFDGHVHYVERDPATGKLTYDHWVMNPKFAAAGGSTTQPSAATLVELKKVPNASAVATIFEFPSIWDLIVWVKPNPSGAF